MELGKMKKLILLFFLLVGLANAQNLATRYSNTFTATGASATVGVYNAVPQIYYVSWTVNPNPAACTFTVDTSVKGDGSDWVAGGLLGAQTCTTNGHSTYVGVDTNYIRINVTALSGGTSLAVTIIGLNTFGVYGNTTVNQNTAGWPNVLAGMSTSVGGNTLASVSTAGLSAASIAFALAVHGYAAGGANSEDAVNDAGTAFAKTKATNIGSYQVEVGPRWSVVSNPAVSNQATASKAAGGTTVRHIADCVSFSAASTTAPAATALTINLRDGATGAGTIIWTYQVVVTAATGQNVVPHSICGLNLVGSANTAMTLEFSALLTNLIESVSVSGYDVQ